MKVFLKKLALIGLMSFFSLQSMQKSPKLQTIKENLWWLSVLVAEEKLLKSKELAEYMWLRKEDAKLERELEYALQSIPQIKIEKTAGRESIQFEPESEEAFQAWGQIFLSYKKFHKASLKYQKQFEEAVDRLVNQPLYANQLLGKPSYDEIDKQLPQLRQYQEILEGSKHPEVYNFARFLKLDFKQRESDCKTSQAFFIFMQKVMEISAEYQGQNLRLGVNLCLENGGLTALFEQFVLSAKEDGDLAVLELNYNLSGANQQKRYKKVQDFFDQLHTAPINDVYIKKIRDALVSEWCELTGTQAACSSPVDSDSSQRAFQELFAEEDAVQHKSKHKNTSLKKIVMSQYASSSASASPVTSPKKQIGKEKELVVPRSPIVRPILPSNQPLYSAQELQDRYGVAPDGSRVVEQTPCKVVVSVPAKNNRPERHFVAYKLGDAGDNELRINGEILYSQNVKDWLMVSQIPTISDAYQSSLDKVLAKQGYIGECPSATKKNRLQQYGKDGVIDIHTHPVMLDGFVKDFGVAWQEIRLKEKGGYAAGLVTKVLLPGRIYESGKELDAQACVYSYIFDPQKKFECFHRLCVVRPSFAAVVKELAGLDSDGAARCIIEEDL